MQHIGLLMTCNEEDCIEEVMDSHVKYFDKILVIDGSSDRTEEILRSYPQVKDIIKDRDVKDKLPNGQVFDGIRQFVLAKIQAMYGYDGWITLLHGDEIYYDNPVEIAEKAERAGVEKVNWYAMNFFLHTTDLGRNLDAIKLVQERVTWYCPGALEIRQYKNKKGIYYDLGRGGKVLAEGVGWKTYKKFPIYKHYPYRSVSQMLKKKCQNKQTGFSCSYNDINENDVKGCFRDILPGFKVARKFDGSFHEFELANQGSMLHRWIRAHKYMPCRVGPFTI